ncbi:MAG: LemA family protein [Elusimicrobiales bacterium]|nr:LemA family protein [Elusimicrobiales bacterium]
MIVAIVVLVILGFWIAAMYNGLVGLRNQVDNAFRQIDVQLKRRHDLIPNLVSAVKGEMKFEQETLQKVMEARAAALGAGKTGDMKDLAAKEGALTAALGRLIAVSENYPQLKANENVSKLMEELTHTENQISFSRQFYNDVTTKFNTKQQVFPTNIFASMFGFSQAQLWELPADSPERENVKVDLSF